MKVKKKAAARPVIDITPDTRTPIWPNNHPRKLPKFLAKTARAEDRAIVLLCPGRVEYDSAMAHIENWLLHNLEDPVIVVADFHLGAGQIMSRRNGWDLTIRTTREDKGTTRPEWQAWDKRLPHQKVMWKRLLLNVTHVLAVKSCPYLPQLLEHNGDARVVSFRARYADHHPDVQQPGTTKSKTTKTDKPIKPAKKPKGKR